MFVVRFVVYPVGVANRSTRVFCCAYLGIKLLNHVGVVHNRRTHKSVEQLHMRPSRFH